MSGSGITSRRGFAPRGVLVVGLCTAALGAAAGSAGAAGINPISADFGNQQVATTSPQKAFTLRVQCMPDPMLFLCLVPDSVDTDIRIAPPGQFVQTNDCLPFLSDPTGSGMSCLINVRFRPTSPGPKEATLHTGDPITADPTATLSGNALAAPGQPGPTLELAAKKQALRKKLTLLATANVDSTLALEGKAIKPTTAQLAAGEETKVKAKLKTKARRKLTDKLDEKGKAKTKLVGTATDARDRTTTDAVKVKLKD
jgi:hypothetical protein